ncbi:MAG: hypothetical protein K6A90_03110 [Lachnospiraceae bacterium]|nr:hypothetical protein [Lachnospiraceae bacterium]
MRLKEMWKRFIVMLLASTVIMTCVPAGTAFAEEAGEAGEGEEAAGENAEEGGETEGEEGAEGEGEMSPEEMQAALEVVKPSSIETNIDGKYLALAFPASSVPEGFSAFTVDYQGEKVMLAQMTSKSATLGAPGLTVTLAYLTDESGNNGEFYICDTTENARMSDMIMINGADDKYIIVLDPGDNVVGPPGFTQHKLQWGSKTAVAWSLPEETVEEDDKSSTEASEVDKVASLFVQKVYADELGLTAGEAAADPISAGAGNDEVTGGVTDDSLDSGDGGEENKADEDAMIALDAIAHTNASGLIQAQPKEFCLLYAIDESANLGFYLYDIERGTYQRYVDIPKGESATLVKYKKLSRTRLFIIIIMAIIMVILVFIFINTLVNRKGDNDYEDDEEDPEEEAMRQRAKAKERKGIGKRERAYLLDEEPEEDEDDEDFEDDYEDDDDEDDEDEDEYEEEKESIIRRRSVTKGKELPQKRAMAEVPVERNRVETEVDWENMEITAGLNPRKTKAVMDAAPKRTIPKKSAADFDLDEDFEFEFINIKK